MNMFLSTSCLLALAAAGWLLWARSRFLQRIYLPFSVVSGGLGLLVLQTAGGHIPAVCTQGWAQMPAVLINLVFVGLFLGLRMPDKSLTEIWRYSGPQLVYGQIVAWGQYVVSLTVSWLILAPLFDSPPFLGVIIPLGFEGGHGMTAVMQPVFERLGWPMGADYGFAAATVGILAGIMTGMILINWAVRHGQTRILQTAGEIQLPAAGPEVPTRPRARRGARDISRLVRHGVGQSLWVAVAILLAVIFRQALGVLSGMIPGLAGRSFFQSLPLAPFSIIGAAVLQRLLARRWPTVRILDQAFMAGLSGLALDFLIIAAIATLNVGNVASGLVPFLILVISAVVWNVACVFWLARRILPDAWFERAIVQFGQSTGITATGLLLLKVVDPRAETKAASAFGYKQVIHEPLMGSGLWPMIAIPLAVSHGPGGVLAVSVAAVMGWLLFWRRYFYRTAAGGDSLNNLDQGRGTGI